MNPKPLKVAFVSTMNGAAWGGSEELWQQTAMRLRAGGHVISASVFQWPSTPAPVSALAAAGARIHFRPRKESLAARMRGRLMGSQSRVPIDRTSMNWLKGEAPDLVVISQGGPWDGVPWMRACRLLKLRYCALVHANSETWWPADESRAANLDAYRSAERVLFVSRANRGLMEMQLAHHFDNAEVVINPWKVDATEAVPWPETEGVFSLAAVGRIDPKAKGSELLMEVLALPKWRDRRIRLNIYGDGPYRKGMEELQRMLNLSGVRFAGHVSDVREIWGSNHALLLPSRYEGLPLVIIEAMLCGRPVITTNVAGNAEYIKDGVTGFVAEAPTVRLVDEALERAWSLRDKWREIGTAARHDLLAALPADPIAVFASKILDLAGGANKRGSFPEPLQHT